MMIKIYEANKVEARHFFFQKKKKKKMSSETLSNSLLRDLSRLYNNSNDYDVIIQVGEESNSEVFKAHSNILRIRSTYFNAALSSNWIKKEGNVITFKKPNIKPDV